MTVARGLSAALLALALVEAGAAGAQETAGRMTLAATFTGSFDMGPPDILNGPFKEPHEMPMRHAFGIKPAYAPAIVSAELCASCHTVHLPIFRDGKPLGYTYEQTTYAEWAFSAYRTGKTPDGDLPFGAGTLAESCQGCHKLVMATLIYSDARGARLAWQSMQSRVLLEGTLRASRL